MCDTLALTANGRTLFAKNSDRPPSEAQILERYPRREAAGSLRTQYLDIPDSGACALVGSRPVWLWGFEHGVNEHRVAIGNEAVYTTVTPSTEPNGLIGMDLVRLGLERGRSAREAIDAMTELLERYGQSGDCYEDGGAYHSSFLIADPREVWVLETAGRTWAVERFESVAISNRISLEAFDDWRDPATDTGFADIRLRASQTCITRGVESPRDLIAHLRSHGPNEGLPVPGSGDDEFSVCMHIRGAANTTAAMVCEPSEDRPVKGWAALGSPCVSVFVPFSIDDVPPILSDVETWHRFATLRDRVERDDSELPKIRAVLDPVEEDVAAEAQNAASRIDAALKKLGV